VKFTTRISKFTTRKFDLYRNKANFRCRDANGRESTLQEHPKSNHLILRNTRSSPTRFPSPFAHPQWPQPRTTRCSSPPTPCARIVPRRTTSSSRAATPSASPASAHPRQNSPAPSSPRIAPRTTPPRASPPRARPLPLKARTLRRTTSSSRAATLSAHPASARSR